MAGLFALVLVFTVAACSAANIPDRIVGGAPTTIEQYPSIVQVEVSHSGFNWMHSCGGSILNNFYVLSAAHCFDGPDYLPSRRRIRAGTAQSNIGGVVTYVVREINHPSFGLHGLDGDITVVRVVTPLTWSDVVQQGLIVAHGHPLPDNLPAVQAGWGAIWHGGPLSDVLLDATVFIVNQELCASRYGPGSITANMICVGILDVGGKGPCQGDSGGPLYFDNIIVGVVSWGYGCGDPYYPGVNTKVSPYTNWITQTAV